MTLGVIKIVFLFVLVGTFAMVRADGATAAEHLEDIRKARGIVTAMLDDITARSSGAPLPPFDAKKVTDLRSTLPAEPRSVETVHGTQSASYAWVHSRLDEFVTERNEARQAAVLYGIDERLAEIVAVITDLENAGRADRTKDEDKQKLTEILAREQFQKPTEKQESIWERWLNSFIKWLESLFPRPTPVESQPSGLPGLARVLQIVMIAGVVVLVLFIVYRLAPDIFPSFRRKAKKEKEDRVILGETVSADSSSADIYREAEALARKGDLRGAIRKGYIAFLFELAERRQIGLARHKTNRDYLRDVRREPALFESMRTLTGIFEASWYGSRDVGEETWSHFKRGYESGLAGKQG